MADQDTELEEMFDLGEDESEEAEAETEETEEGTVDEENEVETEEETEESEETEDETDESATTADEKQGEDRDLVPKAALLDERRKRQEVQERIEKLEALIPEQETDEAPDPYEDLDAYNEYQRKKWEREKQEESRRKRLEKVETRRSEMLEEHDDFEEKERIFELLSTKDASVREEMMQAEDPVKYGYEKATEYYNEVMNPKSVLSEEMPDDEESTEPVKKSPGKPNLAKATAAKSNNVEVESEPELDSDLFADQQY